MVHQWFINGSSMIINGHPWSSMVHTWFIHGHPCSSMVIHAHQWSSMVHEWSSMVINGSSMVINGSSMVYNGHPWFINGSSVVIHEINDRFSPGNASDLGLWPELTSMDNKMVNTNDIRQSSLH